MFFNGAALNKFLGNFFFNSLVSELNLIWALDIFWSFRPPPGMDIQLIVLHLNLAEALAKNGKITETQLKWEEPSAAWFKYIYIHLRILPESFLLRIYKNACEPYNIKAHKLGSKDGGSVNDNATLLDEMLQLEQDIERPKKRGNNNGTGGMLSGIYSLCGCFLPHFVFILFLFCHVVILALEW